MPAIHSSFRSLSIQRCTASSSFGDSTAAYHIDRTNEGYAEAQGWGVFFYAFFDPDKVNVVNLSRGGRSTRTYLTEGLWDKAAAQFKPGDVVLLQLGQNDIFALNDQIARGTIPDIGDEDARDRQHRHPQARDRAYLWLVPAQVRP